MKIEKKLNLPIVILLTILTILGIFLIAKNTFFKTRLPNLNWQELERITIEKENSKSVLIKNNENWEVINGAAFPADKQKTTTFITTLKGLESKTLVSKKKSEQRLFGLDTQKPLITLHFKEGDYPIVIGNESFSNQGTYFKIKKQKNIWLITGFLTEALNTENWKDLSVIKDVSTKAQEIEVDIWGIKKTFKKNDSSNELFKLLDNLRAEKVFFKGEKEAVLNRYPTLKINIKYEDEKIELNFYSSKGDIYLRESTSQYIYLINKEKFDLIKEAATKKPATTYLRDSLPNHYCQRWCVS